MKKINVDLAEHSYELTIVDNQLNQVSEWLQALWTPRMIALITDENVAALYANHVKNQLEAVGYKVIVFTVPAGEESKSLEMATMLYEQLAHYQFSRKDGVIALGGGVVGDLAGFVASTYMRGLSFAQIPTTLLAQVDSSIGGKTAVNLESGKNLVGTFYQPDGVLIDVATLQTLPLRNVREGIAEIVKSAAIADSQLWTRLSELKDEEDLLAHSLEIIAACCEIKRKVVEEDEKESGRRMILNFGHTIGHAIEKTMGYGNVSHGEAVAVGMVQISQIAEKKKQMPSGITEQIRTMLEKFHLPTEMKPEYWDEVALYKALVYDKKNQGEEINIVLLEKMGVAKIVTMPTEEMKHYLKQEIG